MTTWTAGYVADLGYTYGFYRELAPAFLKFVTMTKEHRSLDPDQSLTYCELGCGQGVTTNLLAAANPQIDFHATDFNPSQIVGARALANEAAISNVTFYENSFEELLSEPSLPLAFDIISLHGIYSWISPKNRAYIIEFIRCRLKPGGIVYVSYNTLPGWAPIIPLRRLLSDHANTHTGPITPRINDAISFAESMLKAKASFFTQNPAIAPHFNKIQNMSRSYLAGEYFNEEWNPFYFADIAQEFSEAKLNYVGSASLLDGIDAINLDGNQMKILNSISDIVRRETLRDYMVNQQFRRDVFVKGSLPHPQASSRATWTSQRFALSVPRDYAAPVVKGVLGEAKLQDDVYLPIIDLLSKGPATLNSIMRDPSIGSLGWNKLIEAFTILVGLGYVQPCLSAKDDTSRSKRTKLFNRAVMKRAEINDEIQYLASPITGSGIPVDRISQLFIAAILLGVDPVQRTWSVLEAHDQHLIRDGKSLIGSEANLSELRERYEFFKVIRLPVFRQLGIA